MIKICIFFFTEKSYNEVLFNYFNSLYLTIDSFDDEAIPLLKIKYQRVSWQGYLYLLL